MRFSDLCEKEVISCKDCKCIGCVRDLELDQECGTIVSLIVPGPGKIFGLFGKGCEYFIPWCKVIKIGPDIILVDYVESEMKHNSNY